MATKELSKRRQEKKKEKRGDGENERPSGGQRKENANLLQRVQALSSTSGEGGMEVVVHPFVPAVFAATPSQNHQRAALQYEIQRKMNL